MYLKLLHTQVFQQVGLPSNILAEWETHPFLGQDCMLMMRYLVIYDVILKIIDRYATWEKGCSLFVYIKFCVPIDNHPL